MKTLRLLIISIIVFSLTLITATFWNKIGMTDEQTPILALIIMIAFGLNIAGLIFGFSEKRNNKKKALIGIIGNSALILIYLGLVISALVL
ncbi:MAG: hypothetical protein RH860_03300 [Cytophagales bacterium]